MTFKLTSVTNITDKTRERIPQCGRTVFKSPITKLAGGLVYT